MVEIISVLDKIGFILDDDGSYIGYGYKNDNLIKFEFKNHFLYCYENNDVLFNIIYANLKVGTLLFILEDFGIYHDPNIEKDIKIITNTYK